MDSVDLPSRNQLQLTCMHNVWSSWENTIRNYLDYSYELNRATGYVHAKAAHERNR